MWASSRHVARSSTDSVSTASLAADRERSVSEGPRNHERELAGPERVAMITDALRHHDARARTTQRVRPGASKCLELGDQVAYAAVVGRDTASGRDVEKEAEIEGDVEGGLTIARSRPTSRETSQPRGDSSRVSRAGRWSISMRAGSDRLRSGGTRSHARPAARLEPRRARQQWPRD